MHLNKKLLGFLSAAAILASSFSGSVGVLGAEYPGSGGTLYDTETAAEEEPGTDGSAQEEGSLPEETEESEEPGQEAGTEPEEEASDGDEDGTDDDSTSEENEDDGKEAGEDGQEEGRSEEQEPQEEDAPADDAGSGNEQQEPAAGQEVLPEEQVPAEEPAPRGEACFVMDGSGGVLTLYGEDSDILFTVKGDRDAFTVTDAYGDSAVLDEDGVTVSDSGGSAVFTGDPGSLMADGEGYFVVMDESGSYFSIAGGEMTAVTVPEGTEYLFDPAGYRDGVLSLAVVGEENAWVSFEAAASEEYELTSYDVPSAASAVEEETGVSGSMQYTGTAQSDGNTCRFTFAEKEVKKEEEKQEEKKEETKDTKASTTDAAKGPALRAGGHDSIAAYDYTVTYDANGQTFDGGASTNAVTFHVPEKIISRTSNVDADGNKTGTYDSNLAETDVITIDGAESLHVVITYQTNSTDWVCVYDGSVEPNATNYASSISKKLYGLNKRTREYDVPGDTVQFFFKSGTSSSSLYGYYALVTAGGVTSEGDYMEPETEDTVKFLSWNTAADGSGTTVDPKAYTGPESVTLYAQYKSAPPTVNAVVTFDANGGAFGNGASTNDVTYTVKGAKTSNVDNDGNRQGAYPYPYEENDTVTIDDAQSLYVTVRYGIDGNDYLRLYNAGGSQIASLRDEGEKTYTIAGDSVRFNFESVSATNKRFIYGYYAKVAGLSEGEILVPEKDNCTFTGWNTQPDGSGETVDPGKVIWTENTTLYAQYKGEKQGVLFADGTYVVKDASVPLDDYIAEHGEVIGTESNLEANSGDPFGETINNGNGMNQIKKIVFDTDVTPIADINNPFLWFAQHGNLTEIENIERVDTSQITRMNNAFSVCTALKTLDLSSWDTSNVTDMSQMFASCNSLTEVDASGLDTSNVASMERMFTECRSLVNVYGLKDWNVSKVTSIRAMFANCVSLTDLDLGGWDTSRITNADQPFANCVSLKTLKIDGWDLSNARNISLLGFFASIGSPYMDLVSARNVKIPSSMTTLQIYPAAKYNDFTGLTTGNVKKVGFVGGTPNVETIVLNGWDTGKLEDMAGAFAGFRNLASIPGIESLNTSKLKNAANAFASCGALERLDFSSWDTASLENIGGMFTGCSSLETVNVSTWNTQNIKNMASAFASCSALERIDLSGWDTSGVTNMNDILNGATALKEIVLGENFQFKEGQSGLPYPDWLHVDTDTPVSDLWNNYDAANLPGTYRRTEILTELNKDNTDGIEYDSDTGEITVYIDTDEFQHPAGIEIPSLFSTLRLHPELVEENEELAALLESAKEGGTYEDLSGLKLTLKARTYADISSCSKSGNFIWTFDVPKDSSGVIRTDIYECSEGEKTYAGYITNSEEEPDVFTQYDADGNVVETLQPGARHKYSDIGYVFEEGQDYVTINGKTLSRAQAEEYVYPEYDAYISYNSYMDNYEAVLPAGKYVFETTTPTSVQLSLTPVLPGTDGDGGGEINGYYSFTTPGVSEYAYMTVFNEIKRSGTIEYTLSSDTYGIFTKVDASSGRGVPDAVYRFTGKTTGDVAYGKTNASGEISRTNLKESLNGQGVPSGTGYVPVLYEVYIAEEISAPEGYYINPQTVEVRFHIDHSEITMVDTSHMVYSDGMSDTLRGTQQGPNAVSCTTCMTGSSRCLCIDYGDCRCVNCGVHGDETNVKTRQYRHSDTPWPRLNITKKDALGNTLPGAVLQLIDKETEEVVDEWTTGDLSHVHQFNLDGKGQVPYGNTGKAFIIREKTPPENYSQSDDIEVTIAYTSGTVSRTMIDDYAPHEVIISKTDINGHEIDGAQLEITGRETGASADITPISWVSVEGEDKPVSLRPGTYTLHERAVPEGGVYVLASDITFTVDENGVVKVADEDVEKVTMIDVYNVSTLKVKKTVTGNMGSRTRQFGFTVTLKNADNTPYANAVPYTKGTENGTYTPDAEGRITFTLAHGEEIELKDLTLTTKYTVEEEDCRSDGYGTTSENAEGTIAAANPDVSFVNSKGSDVPTGASTFPKAGLLFTGFAALAGIALLLGRRFRRN